MLFEQFCRLRPTISRGWSWYSVPVLKRRRAFSCFPSRDWGGIWAQTSSLKLQQRSDEMVSFHDYKMYLLFLLSVRFHGSGKCEIYSPVQRISQCFLPCAILSLDTDNADPFISKLDVRQNDLRTIRRLLTVLYFKIPIWCWDFNQVINEVWITMMR